MMKTPNPKHIQGSTLLEVMVSVLILAFGILALMLTQIRSVAGIAYAENQTLVAQAAEALAEGMQANPTLDWDTTNDPKTLKITYDNYHTDSATISGTPVFAKLNKTANSNKKELAALQLTNFQAALSQIPDVESMHYAICRDKDNPDLPELDSSGKFDSKCSKANLVNGAVIKVAWLMKDNNQKEKDKKATFTYVLKVKG